MLSHMEFFRLAEGQALVLRSDAGSIVFANTKAHALFGYPPEESTGQGGVR
jgi:PAS domain-containing protein